VTAVQAAEISLDVQPNRTQIYQGESLVLNVTVNGADAGLSPPDLAALAADIQLLGTQSNSRRMISYVNGRMSREETQARLFAFQVRPRTSGVFATGPVTLSYKGARYTASGPAVQVIGQEPQDLVVATLAASRASVLVEEPFTITLAVFVAGLAPPNDKIEPIYAQNPPRLEADFLNQAEIPGLQTPDLKNVLGQLVNNDPRRPSFAINNYQSQALNLFADPFGDGDPFRPRPIRFRLATAAVKRDGRAGWEYTITLSYLPRQEGDYTFGPLSFKGEVIVGADTRGQPQMRQISCVGPAVTVRVIPPAETNRPDCFIGSVGSNLTLHAELDASVCKVGDPLTLTLDVAGAVSLGNMRPPLLNLQSDLTSDFRIYDDNVASSAIPSGKRFQYRLRPIREGTLEFPPIQVAWFDTASRTYRIALSEPIPVQARANAQLMEEGHTNGISQMTRLEIERTATIPAAIMVSAAGARTAVLLPSRALVVTMLLSGPVVLLLTWCGLALYRSRRQLTVAYRRRCALSRVLADLRQPGLAAQPEATTVGRLVRRYLAERLNVAGGALTPAEVLRLLQAHHVTAATTAACGELLARLDQELYHPGADRTGGAATIQAACTLLTKVADELDHPHPPREEQP
jgi:hypothetical protein